MARVALMTFYDDKAMGIRTLGAYLKEQGHISQLLFLKRFRSRTVDVPIENNVNYLGIFNGELVVNGYDANPLSDEEIDRTIEALEEFKPDIIGISTRSCFDDLSERVVGRFRERLPEALYLGGGFGPTLAYERWLNFVDLVVCGDGEEAMLDIANYLDEAIPLEDIPNTAYRKDGEFKVIPFRPPVKDLSRYPHPFMPHEHSIYIGEEGEFFDESDNAYDILMGRGCVGTCSFCSGGSYRGMYKDNGLNMPPRRMRDVDDIMLELCRAKEMGYTHINFWDEFLIAPMDILYSLFTQYRDQIGLPFFAQIHPHVVKNYPDFIEFLVEIGLQYSVVAIQSGNEDFSKDVYCRRQRNEDLIDFGRRISKHGLPVSYQFIRGNPVEPESNFNDNMELIKKLPYNPERDSIQLTYFTPFPRSPIVKRFGTERLSGYDRTEWHRDCLLHVVRAMSNDEEFDEFMTMEKPADIYESMLDMSANKVVNGQFKGIHALFGNKLEKRVIDKLQGKPVYLWGVSGGYANIKDKLGDIRIVAAFDNDPNKVGAVEGEAFKIHPPGMLPSMELLPVLITSAYYKEIREQILKMVPEAPTINLNASV